MMSSIISRACCQLISAILKAADEKVVVVGLVDSHGQIDMCLVERVLCLKNGEMRRLKRPIHGSQAIHG